MKKFATFLILFLSTIISYSVTKQLTVNDVNGNVFPEIANYQSAWYPVFSFVIPDGYTDFELKGSVINYGDINGDSTITSHNGTEVIYYYNSMYPYADFSDTGKGATPFQKFHEVHNQVYFTASRAIRYTYNGSFFPADANTWDPRKWIRQIPSFEPLTKAQINYSLDNYTIYNQGSINSVIVIIGYDRNAIDSFNKTMKELCKPTNTNLVWSILFYNRLQSERDNGNYNTGTGTGAKWKAIMPIYWVNNLTPKVGGSLEHR